MRFGWSAGSSSALSRQTAGFGQLERNVRGCDPHLFALQDEIVARLANALQVQLVAAEARRAERAPTPDSMDLYFQGQAWLNKGRTPDNVGQARGLFDRALSADPTKVDALVGSAWAGTVEGIHLFVTDRLAAFAAAE